MSKTRLALKYLQYKMNACTDHDLHSPFVYNLYTELIRNKHQYYDFETLNQVRNQLLQNNTSLLIEDLGAGSKTFHNNRRYIKDIAAHGISQKKYAEFLYRLANKFAPATIVELGTSLGLTTLYLAKACPRSRVYTIEGSESLFNTANSIFSQQKQTNIETIRGNFDTAFPELLKSIPSLDLLYIDGNHAYEPTMRYFESALSKKTNSSVFIFDDIYWSPGMEKAWHEIRQHPEVTLSLDLFYIGIIFFRKEQKQKEHFVLRY
ncbi:MAG: class I SAM-dependent methyltransferase [Bacteroidetes bacterium]|nr:class I SAM-dependent methyltransferase [Bacteroidota bacterium]